MGTACEGVQDRATTYEEAWRHVYVPDVEREGVVHTAREMHKQQLLFKKAQYGIFPEDPPAAEKSSHSCRYAGLARGFRLGFTGTRGGALTVLRCGRRACTAQCSRRRAWTALRCRRTACTARCSRKRTRALLLRHLSRRRESALIARLQALRLVNGRGPLRT